MRVKKLFKNFISEILPQAFILILAVVKSKIFLDYLGEATTGLIQLFSQLMAYLSLAEGGLSQAVVYRLYKPVVNKNWLNIAKIKNGTRAIFKKIIIAILVISVFVSFIIPYLIKGNTFNIEYIVINFIIYVVSEVILYTTVFERSLYIATEKAYKSNLVIKTSLFVKKIIEILIAIVFRNISLIFISFIIISLVENILVMIMSKKDFKDIKETKEQDKSILSDVKNLLVHKIAGLVATNIDIIIISSNIGLDKVVVYSTYYAFISSLISLLNKISTAFLGTIGNIIEEVKENSYNAFKEYNGFVYSIALLIGGVFLFAINYFINMFYDGKVETSLFLSLMFTIILIYNIIRLPLVTYTEGAGLFKETKICPIIESIVNLTLSLVFIRFLGIVGCLFGTIISLIVSEYIIKPKIIFRKVFKKSVFEYYKSSALPLIAIVIQLIVCVFIQKYVAIDNYFQLVLYTGIFFIINFVYTIIVLKISNQNYIIARVKQLFSKNKAEEKI